MGRVRCRNYTCLFKKQLYVQKAIRQINRTAVYGGLLELLLQIQPVAWEVPGLPSAGVCRVVPGSPHASPRNPYGPEPQNGCSVSSLPRARHGRLQILKRKKIKGLLDIRGREGGELGSSHFSAVQYCGSINWPHLESCVFASSPPPPSCWQRCCLTKGKPSHQESQQCGC